MLNVQQSIMSEVDKSMTMQAVAIRGTFEQTQLAQFRVCELVHVAKREQANGYVVSSHGSQRRRTSYGGRS